MFFMGNSMISMVIFNIIGLVLREHLNRKPMGFYHQIGWAFRFQFSHHPIYMTIARFLEDYPLVINITMENHNFSWEIPL